MKSFYVLWILTGFLFVSCGNYTTKHFVPPDDKDISGNNDKDVSDEETDDSESDVTDIGDPDEEYDVEIPDENDDEDDDSSSFIPVTVCGNDRVEGNEVCDGNRVECEEFGYISGWAYCKPDCTGWSTGTCLKECEEDTLKCSGSTIIKCVDGKYSEISDCADNSEICRGGRCMDPSQTDSRLDFEGPVFSGDKVLVYHYSVNGNATNSTGTLSQTTLFSTNSNSYNIPDSLRTDLRPPSPKELGLPPVPAKLYEPLKSFNVGDKDTFHIYDFGSSGTKAITATLRKSGTYCEVWVEDGGTSVTDAEINSIISEFDDVIYYLVTENFYEVADIDGNGVVSILLANLGGYAAGYVTMADFYTKQQYPQSNFRDLLYIERSMGTNSTNSTIVHEFQHLVHANRNFLIEKDQNSGELYYRWIDEGLAMAAQHMYEGAQTDMLYVLNNSSYNGPTRDGNSFLYWDYYDQDKVYSDYAGAYVFFQYLRIQSGFNTSIYREIIECTTNDYRCVENIVRKYVDPDYNLSDFIVDFRIALVLQDDSGPYSFGGEKAFKFTIPDFTGSSVNLRGGGAITISSYGSFTKPSNAGSNIIFVGINTK
jgi:hypothetical protein